MVLVASQGLGTHVVEADILHLVAEEAQDRLVLCGAAMDTRDRRWPAQKHVKQVGQGNHKVRERMRQRQYLERDKKIKVFF